MSLKVTIIENGPAIIDNGIEDIEITCSMFPNQPLPASKLAICRCGKSANKVWCDGSHKFKTIDTIPTDGDDEKPIGINL